MTLANMSEIVIGSDIRAEAIDGWMTRPELEWLVEQSAKCQTIVEIGVWKGRSTMAICDACPGLVVAIDHFRGGRDQLQCRQMAADEDLYATARENLAEHIASGRLTLVAMDSRDAWQLAQRELACGVDMVFIDGGHDYEMVAADIANYRRLLNPGGILSGHDYTEGGIQRALSEAFPDGVDNPAGDIWATTIDE